MSQVKMIHASSPKNGKSSVTDPTQNLESDKEVTDGVPTVCVKDRGSRILTALVIAQGVEVWGIVDIGADITIMGAALFKKVAAIAHLKKSQLKPPDKMPYMYM